MLRANDQLGPFTLIKQLGKGAFGVVWLAEKRTAIATSTVAIKIPLDAEPDLEAIKREAVLWASIGGHPNVLPMIEANIYDDYVVIVSEYAPNGSLDGWLKQHNGKAPSLEAAVIMTIGILSGLEHLHDKRVLHRDLKPANILLQGETPRLSDFGLSRILKTNSQFTQPSGTPVYMSPESFDGNKIVQTDLWAVGVILYQLLCGELPFTTKDYASLMGAIMLKAPQPLPATVPIQFQEIITKSLQKDPVQRYASASEMKNALQQLLNRLSAGRLLEPIEKDIKPNSDELPPLDKLTDSLPVELQTRALGSEPATKEAQQQATNKTTSSLNTNSSKIPIVFGSALIIAILLVGLVFKFTNRASGTANLPTQPFIYKTAKTDINGKIVTQSEDTANYFSEDLGGGVRLDMVAIPEGSFKMGTALTDKDYSKSETPQHQVNIKAFYIGKFEVSQAQWRAIMGYDFPSITKGDSLPVENLTWYEAQDFCQRLSKKTGREYRLPSEAEWEYACRAGTTTKFFFGETPNEQIINFGKDLIFDFILDKTPSGEPKGKTQPIGKLGIANPFGLYEVHGNMFEWCQDNWHDDYQGAPDDGSAWSSGGNAALKVLRSGSWASYSDLCRSAARTNLAADKRVVTTGLRVATFGTPSR